VHQGGLVMFRLVVHELLNTEKKIVIQNSVKSKLKF